MKLRRRRRVKAFPQKRSQLQVGMGFRPKMGCGAPPRPVHLAGQRLRRRPDKCDAGRRPSGRRIPRPAASGRTLSLSLVLFPPKPLRWVSAGTLLGAVIKLPCYIFYISVWGVSLTLRLLWLCRNNPARGLFRQKKRLSQSGCSAPTDTLFPPAHSAFSAFLHGGGITTLGVRFMPLKRWTRRSYGSVFVVFMPPRCSPCAG